MNTEKLWTVINHDIALVDFSVSWCAPCRIQEKIINTLFRRFSGQATMAVIDLEADRQLAADFLIQSVPTLILFRNGKEVRRFVGLQSEETLKGAIENLVQVKMLRTDSKRQRDA